MDGWMDGVIIVEQALGHDCRAVVVVSSVEHPREGERFQAWC